MTGDRIEFHRAVLTFVFVPIMGGVYAVSGSETAALASLGGLVVVWIGYRIARRRPRQPSR